MSKKAADRVFRQSGLSPSDVQVVELHDCFSANELISYEALGLCPPGNNMTDIMTVRLSIETFVTLQVKPVKWWIEGTTHTGGNMLSIQVAG